MENNCNILKKTKKRGVTFVEKYLRPQKLVYAVVFLVFALYALSMLVAFLMLVLYSLQNRILYEIALEEPFSIPTKFIIDNYVFAFKEMQYRDVTIFGMIFNSVWYTFLCTVGPILMSLCTGYALAKYKFKARGLYYGLIIFSMTIPVVGTTAARLKLVSDIKLFDSPFYVLFSSLSGGGINFLVVYAFFKNISWEYAEAAFMDGAGHFYVFFRIMIPMATPAVGALAILTGIGAWNAYMDVLLYLPSWPTLSSGLYGLSQTLPRQGNTPGYYAALVIAFIPVLIVFCMFSDRIMRNFSVGGLKG